MFTKTVTSVFSIVFLTTSMSAFAADKGKEFSDELCSAIAASGDEMGTDSADAYATACREQAALLIQRGVTTKKGLTKAICRKAHTFSQDYNDMKEGGGDAAELRKKKKELIAACMESAASIGRPAAGA